MLQDSVTLKVISSSDEPKLLSFPQGIPSSGIHDDDSLPLIIGQKGAGKRKKHIISTELNGVTYKGYDFDEYATRNDTCKYLIGVLKPGSNEMQLMPTEHIFVMRPQLISKEIIPRNSTMTSYERRASLTEEFGSKKKKRAVQAAQSNTILTENISGASAVESAMVEHFENFEANSILMTAADDALEQNRQSLLPRYNLNATSPEEAYPIDELISHDMMSSIKKYMESIGHVDVIEALENSISGEGSDESITSLMSNISLLKPNTAISSATSDVKKWKKYRRSLERLYVLAIMIKFYKIMIAQQYNTILKADVGSKINTSDYIINYMVTTFTSTRKQQGKQAYSMTKVQLDKLLMHVIVIGLHMSDFRVDLTTIAKDLKLTPQALCNIARELGCKLSKQQKAGADAAIMMAELPIPLKFPPRKMKRGTTSM